MTDVNQQIDQLRSKWSAYRLIDKKPRQGCLDSGNFATWQCCGFHKELSQKDDQMTQEAIQITLHCIKNSHQDEQVPDMVRIDGELMSVLSVHWWEVIDARSDRR